jgi:hypothetical protein
VLTLVRPFSEDAWRGEQAGRAGHRWRQQRHGVLQDRETYEIIDASSVGQEAAQIVLGKHSGRHAFKDTLEKMGIHVQGDALNASFVRFKELADKKIEITEADPSDRRRGDRPGMVHRYSVSSSTALWVRRPAVARLPSGLIRS